MAQAAVSTINSSYTERGYLHLDFQEKYRRNTEMSLAAGIWFGDFFSLRWPEET